MRKVFPLLLSFWTLLIGNLSCQSKEIPSNLPETYHPQLKNRLVNLLSFEAPLISVDSLNNVYTDFTILDARELKEYNTSHLEGAKHIGYKKADFSVLDKTKKSQPIVVYCTVGYRSEKIAKQIADQGYTNVYNLYGSVAEWTNKGYPLVNKYGTTTEVHTYNKKWSQWFLRGDHKY